MNDTHKKNILSANCEVCFDTLTRQLYATDASIYQIQPLGVAFPRSAEQAASIMSVAADSGLAITPRGAGTGLAGGAIGSGLVIDFSRHNRTISELNLERRSVRVGPGVVLDQLNAFVKPHGLTFGPDVATSSRATLGGMIANNSSGARAPLYGTTGDHVVSLDIVLPDGSIQRIGAGHDSLRQYCEEFDELVLRNAATIRDRFPEGLVKRWPGYGLSDYLKSPGDLVKIICGSEGTLASIVSAELQLVSLPEKKGVGLVFFASDSEAMQATVELLDLKPAAIEHVDHVAFDQTAGQRAFKQVRSLLKLDEEPCKSFLIVEFYEDVEDRLEALKKKNLGLRMHICANDTEMSMVWGLRKAGLSLLTGRIGPAKPIAGLEDVAVKPEDLPAYVNGFKKILKPMDMQASFYGHAAAGLLHVRPVVDLHKAEEIAKFRNLCEEISALTREFKGSFASEHGVGLARVEFMPEHLGSELLAVMHEIKNLFDPGNVMNPGKVLPDGRFKIDTDLRQGGGHEIKLPFEPTLAFVFKDGSFIGNLEQCTGCGGCRKEEPTMCPTYQATGEELMSTRGRANTIRAALEHRLECEDMLTDPDLEKALAYCLSCKACTTECPSNVNLSLLKAELIHARHRKNGTPLVDRILSSVELLGKIGCRVPGLANATLNMSLPRKIMQKVIGISTKRPLPRYTSERFDKWFLNRSVRKNAPRGRVFLWDDCFVRYNDPHIGRAAVTVLEAAGYRVELLKGRECCGRPAFSRGCLDVAKRLGEHNLNLLKNLESDDPLIFLEPSCYSMFAEDYRELGIDGAQDLAQRCVTFEEFIFDLLQHDPKSINFTKSLGQIAIHEHCHAKALTDISSLLKRGCYFPETDVKTLKTSCCGMAGAFGMMEDKYELSLEIAKPLIDQIGLLGKSTYVIASGTSCRQQIEHLAQVHPLHMAEAMALACGFSEQRSVPEGTEAEH